MQSLSKQDETKILLAIEKAAGLVNDGLTPNDAIVKAATDAELRPGHIRLMVCAYNTGRTTRQRELGETPFEKAADFELADHAKILEIMFPNVVKSAAELQREQAVSFEYAVTPGGMIARWNQQLSKAAAAKTVVPQLCEPPPPIPRDPQALLKRAHSQAAACRQQIDESRRGVANAQDDLTSLFVKLAGYFRSPGHVAFGDAEAYTELLYGQEGLAVLKHLSAAEHHLAKQAATNRVHSAQHEPYPLIGRLLTSIHTYHEKQAAHAQLAVDLEARAQAALLPFVRPPSNSILAAYSAEKQAVGIIGGSMAGGFAKDVLGNVAKQLQPPPDNDLAESGLKALTDPRHESTLRNIRVHSMLQDLMTNDPVISGYDPDESLGAFNEIGEVAPRAVDQRLLMQTLMRRRLQQGALDPSEVDQLLGMEGKLKSRNTGGHDVKSVL